MVTNFCTDAPHTVNIVLSGEYAVTNYLDEHDFPEYEHDAPLLSFTHTTGVCVDGATTMIPLSLAALDRMMNEYAREIWVTASQAHLWGTWNIGTTA